MPMPVHIYFTDDIVWTFIKTFPAGFTFFGVQLNEWGPCMVRTKKPEFHP